MPLALPRRGAFLMRKAKLSLALLKLAREIGQGRLWPLGSR